jgi:membrane protein YqaA with SNARE-associated domain
VTDGGRDVRVPSELGSVPGKRPGPLRRLYDWVLHWAYTPYGSWALFLLALAESSFFPIPPDPLLMALCLGAAKKALKFAAVATAASVLGGLIGYAVGAGVWGVAEPYFYAWVPGVSPEAFARVQGLYDRWDFWAIFLAGLTPIPYKVFTISAGVFDINLGIFVLASLTSRGLRFFAVSALIYKWGKPMSDFIDRYFDVLSILFGILLVGGFLVIEFVL